jgi:hypothetical protein
VEGRCPAAPGIGNRRALHAPEEVSILELEGMRKEIWERIDAATHVEQERASWD